MSSAVFTQRVVHIKANVFSYQLYVSCIFRFLFSRKLTFRTNCLGQFTRSVRTHYLTKRRDKSIISNENNSPVYQKIGKYRKTSRF